MALRPRFASFAFLVPHWYFLLFFVGTLLQDDCVLVWNVETGTTTKKIFGPHVCGDSIDVVGRTILTGSWRDDSQVRRYSRNIADWFGEYPHPRTEQREKTSSRIS